jgi:hypothetical protein
VSSRRAAVAVLTAALSVGVPAAWATQQVSSSDSTTTSSAVARDDSSTDLCTEAGSRRTETPTSALQWERAFHELHGVWSAGDQASSVQLDGGRTLWLFGDTLQARDASGGVHGERGHTELAAGEQPASHRMVHNTLVLSDGCLMPVAGPGGSSFLPDVDSDTWYWPGHAVADGDTVTMTVTVVRRTGPGPFDFIAVADAIAVVRAGARQLPQLVSVTRVHEGLTPTSVVWGAAIARHAGWTYVYGTRTTGRPLEFGKELYVARVRPGDEPKASRWRYWDGHGWSARSAGAVPVHGAVGGVSSSLSVFYGADRWVAITKKDGVYGRDVVALTSERPTGPWAEHRLFAAPTDPDGVMRYTALAHPGVGTRSGRLLVSVSRNEADAQRVSDDPSRYEPEFHEVTLR